MKRRSKSSKYLKYLPVLIIAVLVVIFIAWGGIWTKSLRVLSPSMSPAIKEGDSVQVRKCDISEAKIGDIVTYTPIIGDNTFLTHRVVDIYTDENGEIFLTTRGDDNNVDDPNPVTKEKFYGIVVRINFMPVKK